MTPTTMTPARRFIPTVTAALLIASLATPALRAQSTSFRLPGLESGALRPESLAEGTTIIVVWASWSPRCRTITEQVDALNRKWRDRAKVVAVNFQERPEVIRKAVAAKPMPVPVYMDADGAFSKMHAVTTLPHVLVYTDGKRLLSQRLTRDVDTLIAARLR